MGGPLDQLASILARLQRQAEAGALTRGLRIPIVDEDPPAGDTTNLWAFDDGRIRWRDSHGVVRQIATTTGGTTTSATPKVADPMPLTHRDTWAPTWARLFCATHGVEPVAEYLAYGNAGDVHGDRLIMLGFDHTAIAAALAGAEVTAVELSALNVDSPTDPVTVAWGGHNVAAAPATYSAVRRAVFTADWPRNGYGAQWRGGRGDVVWLGRALRDGQIKGLVVDQQTEPGSSGLLAWQSVRLRITYNVA